MSRIRAAIVAATVSGLVIAGCGGDDKASSGAVAGNQQLRVAYASALDPNDVADQMGLVADGAKVTTLTDDSAVVAGLLRDSADVGNVDFDAAIKAKASGVPLKIIYISQMKPEYVLVSRPEITSYEDLAGKKVGFHARGSQTDIFVHNLLEQKAPGVKVEYLALEESSRRAQAMAAGRLDASALEAINLAALKQEGDYHQLGSWADLTGEAAGVRGTAWITTEEGYEKNKERLTTFVANLQKGYDQFYADKEAWLAAAAEAVSDVDQELLPDVYESYKGQEMYPKGGTPALTPEDFKTSEKFFRELGGWEDEQADDIVAFDLVDAGAGGS
jgi:ABC-type nitrate/sulfonate/bicarbonate transport system substrate-binding protein